MGEIIYVKCGFHRFAIPQHFKGDEVPIMIPIVAPNMGGGDAPHSPPFL